MKRRMLVPVAAVLCAAACGDSSVAYPGHPGTMVVVMTATATRAQADEVIARCGGLPGADGGENLMDDERRDLRLHLEDDVTGAEERKIRKCLASSPGVDVARSDGFPVPL